MTESDVISGEDVILRWKCNT